MPSFTFIISTPERVSVIEVMHGSDNFIESILLQYFSYLFTLAFLYSEFDTFENTEVCGNLRQLPGMDKGIDPIDFSISGCDIENFRDAVLVLGLHRRYEKIAMVCKTDSSELFGRGLT